MLTALIAGLTSAVLILSIVMQPVVEQQTMEIRDEWVEHPLGDASPGTGNTGFMYIMVYPHSGNPGTDYQSNLSNATAYEYSDSTSGELTGETPFNTAVDYVMKVRVNKTDGYNESGSSWQNDWVRANITIDFDYASDVSDLGMTEVEIGTGGSYRWYHYYANNAGSGYQITKGETFDITALTFDVYE